MWFEMAFYILRTYTTYDANVLFWQYSRSTACTAFSGLSDHPRCRPLKSLSKFSNYQNYYQNWSLNANQEFWKIAIFPDRFQASLDLDFITLKTSSIFRSLFIVHGCWCWLFRSLNPDWPLNTRSLYPDHPVMSKRQWFGENINAPLVCIPDH